MTHRLLSFTIAGVALAGVVGVAWWGYGQRTSPGPLHSSHASVPELKGNRGCDACHGKDDATKGDFARACNVCHRAIDQQLTQGVGLHGQLDSLRHAACEACHHEHLGDAAPLVSDASFRAVGSEFAAEYDHKHVGGLGLEGRHRTLACADCHKDSNAPHLTVGQTRYLGLSKVCGSCHEDVHKGDLGADCASCHGQDRPLKESPLFQHPKSFPLTGGHGGRQCVECHSTPKVFTGASTECVSCHQPAYDKTTKPSHAVAKLGTQCASCHETNAWTPARFTHPDGFLLVGAHERTACVICHSQGPSQAQVFAYQATKSCVSCHASPHVTQLVEAAGRSLKKGSDACVVCHHATDKRWSEGAPRLTPQLHAATGFPLIAPHARQKCEECHPHLAEDAAPRASLATWRKDYPGRSRDACERCHQDPHQAQFAETASKGACFACHSRERFFPNTFDADKHATTAFPLDGSHRAVACALCHKKEDNGVRMFTGVSTACADCHEDVHAGKFDRANLPKTAGGSTGCVRCHNTSDFQRVTWTSADHQTWTGEPLTGKHADATCNSCHRREAPRSGRASPLKTAPTACAACHADVHAGQFNAGAGVDCARCHRSTESFRTITFDHRKDSRYALDAQHQKLECAACHRPLQVGGRSVIRYKPLGVQCADCHDPRGPRPASGGQSP